MHDCCAQAAASYPVPESVAKRRAPPSRTGTDSNDEHFFEIMFADDTNLFTRLCRRPELEHLLEQVLGH